MITQGRAIMTKPANNEDVKRLQNVVTHLQKRVTTLSDQVLVLEHDLTSTQEKIRSDIKRLAEHVKFKQ
tara:strand:+ start:320 stop:526 length:207 start_codon:yes stop_codon:yes gene_type:complete